MNDASEFWQAVRDYNTEKEDFTMKVKQKTFADRMKMRKIEIRVNAIEKKQAERYPNLIERLDRIEQSIVALVNKQNAAMYNIQYPDD
jgi:hypothetical protein